MSTRKMTQGNREKRGAICLAIAAACVLISAGLPAANTLGSKTAVIIVSLINAVAAGGLLIFFIGGVYYLITGFAKRDQAAAHVSPIIPQEAKVYLLQCLPEIIEPRKQESMWPLHIVLQIMAGGFKISTISSQGKLDFVGAAGIGLYHWMSDKNSTEPFTIPYDAIDEYYYLLYYQAGNTKRKLQPPDGLGFKGPVEEAGEYKNVEIGLIYRNASKKTRLKLELIALNLSP